MLARENFDGPHVWDNGRTPRRMLKKTGLLTRPTLSVIPPAHPESAKTDSSPWNAPCPKQGRSERRGEAYTSVRWASERGENEAGGLFQHPARRPPWWSE